MTRPNKPHQSSVIIPVLTPAEVLALDASERRKTKNEKPSQEVVMVVAHNIDQGHYSVCGCGAVYAGGVCPQCHSEK